MIRILYRLAMISRPISWPNTTYPFAAAYLLAGGGADMTFWVGVVYFMIPYNLMMYGINDVFDYESDIRNPRKGGVEGMREQRAFHPTIVRAVFIANVPFIIYFMVVGWWWAAVVLIGVVFFVLAYSLKYLRFKERPVLDSITSSLHFVGPMLVALAFIGAPFENWWMFAVAFFVWGMASHAFGAVQDIVPDREGRIASIATVVGARWTVRMSMFLYTTAAVLVALQGGWLLAVAAAGAMYAINLLPYWDISDEQSAQANRGWRRFLWLNYVTGAVVTIVLIADASGIIRL